ncbi:hypothetical protein [Algibacter sp.]|uniref:hypothetical protein n=1 Tax=Algibacter sp. TaxID=1872428 RepID=UPI003C7087E4
MLKKKLICIVFILLNGICGYCQIVNQGVFHISGNTKVCFDNEFTNEKGGEFSNKGNLYLKSNFVNNGSINTDMGLVYFKTLLNPEIKFSAVSNSESYFELFSIEKNRLKYKGQETRIFLIDALISSINNNVSDNKTTFLIKKNSNVFIETACRNQSISSKVELAFNDYIEIWEQRPIGDGAPSVNEFSLIINSHGI